MSELTEKQFRIFRDLIHERSGIFLSDNKISLVATKLGKRIRALKLGSVADYLRHVENDASNEEIVQLLDVISVNVTSFFREPHHFRFLSEKVLPPLLARGEPYIHIWSAACATGEEPYTLAMVLRESVPDLERRDVKILATDISTAALKKAQAGVYPEDRFEKMDRGLRSKYFTRAAGPRGEACWQAGESLRELIRIRHFNLNGDSWPFKKLFDVIFCRNAMIYFNRETQEALVARFASMLKPGGYLFVGHSESLVGIRHPLDYVDVTTYQKREKCHIDTLTLSRERRRP